VAAVERTAVVGDTVEVVLAAPAPTLVGAEAAQVGGGRGHIHVRGKFGAEARGAGRKALQVYDQNARPALDGVPNVRMSDDEILAHSASPFAASRPLLAPLARRLLIPVQRLLCRSNNGLYLYPPRNPTLSPLTNSCKQSFSVTLALVLAADALGIGADTTQKGSNVTDSKSHTVHLQGRSYQYNYVHLYRYWPM